MSIMRCWLATVRCVEAADIFPGKPPSPASQPRESISGSAHAGRRNCSARKRGLLFLGQGRARKLLHAVEA